MQDYILRIVLLDNPWLEGTDLQDWIKGYLPEVYIPRTARTGKDSRICMVAGPRQAGKSTLLWKTFQQHNQRVLFLNCEELAIREWLQSPASFLADIKDLSKDIQYLFFEEIQHLSDAGLFLKGLADRRTVYRIYATGSSSFDLESRTRESLAGRARRQLVFPLSLKEISDTIDLSPVLKEKKLSHILQDILIHGSYPAVYTAQDPRGLIPDLVEAFVIRDASDRFHIKHITAFRKVLELAASQIGNLCNYSEWASLSGISNDTVSQYLNILEDTHIVKLVRPFFGGKRAEITRAPKVFYIDNGIRNQIFGGFQPIDRRPDKGALMENFVFSEIWKCVNPLLDHVHFWRTKSGAEIDFVIESKGKITGCEVKYREVTGSLTRSARSFIEAYKPEFFLIVSQQSHPDQDCGGTIIKYIKPWDISDNLKPVIS